MHPSLLATIDCCCLVRKHTRTWVLVPCPFLHGLYITPGWVTVTMPGADRFVMYLFLGEKTAANVVVVVDIGFAPVPGSFLCCGQRYLS